MTIRASGPFEVKLSPLELHHPQEGASLGRMSIDKEFKGDLEATSQGEMLTAGNPGSGSAGYVAIELVSGTLHGHRGTFILQHSATMNRGEPSLTISVVPDTGTGELTGLTGTMAIIIDNGAHTYQFDYSLPDNS